MKKLILYITMFLISVPLLNNSLKAQQWQKFGTGLDSIEITALTSHNDKIYAGTKNHGIMFYGSENNQWQNLNNGIKINHNDIHSIEFVDNKIFASTSNGLYISSDEGNNWNIVSDGDLEPEFTPVSTVFAFSNNVLFCEGSKIFLSENKGEKWQKTASGGIYQFVNSIVLKGNDLIAGTLKGKILLSHDNGKSWDSIFQAGSVSKIAVYENSLFLATYNGIYRTDNLKDWTFQNSGLPDVIIEDILITSRLVIVSTRQGIYFSKKSSELNWIPFNDGLPNLSVKNLTITGNTLYADTPNEGIYKMDITTVSVSDQNVQDEFTIFPNPAKDIIEINYNIEAISNAININIFNILGIEVMNKEISQTDKNFRLDISHLTAGIYFIRIGDKTGRFVKM